METTYKTPGTKTTEKADSYLNPGLHGVLAPRGGEALLIDHETILLEIERTYPSVGRVEFNLLLFQVNISTYCFSGCNSVAFFGFISFCANQSLD